MAELTQKRFAALLKAGMKGMGDIKPAEVSRRTEEDGGKKRIDPNTLSEYVKPDYPNGPPKRETRARLERAIDLPAGYLDGDVEVNLEEWRKRRRQLLAEREMQGHDESERPEPDDQWQAVVRDDSEQAIRDLLHSVERVMRGTSFDLKESARRRALAYRYALEIAEDEFRLAGKKPGPAFRRVKKEVENGTFP